jgi:hypothetical protein
MIVRTLLAGIAVAAFAVWASAQTLAFEGEFLSSKKLQQAYRHFCPINIGELKALLRTKKTKVRGTTMLVVETYKDNLKCDYQTDVLYKSLENPDDIKETDEYIRKVGREKYVEQATASSSEIRLKYKIDLLLELAESSVGLSEDELFTLVAFEQVKSRKQALLLVVKSP